MAELSEWLQLMLAEIARKQEEERAAAEEQRLRAHPAADAVSPATATVVAPAVPATRTEPRAARSG